MANRCKFSVGLAALLGAVLGIIPTQAQVKGTNAVPMNMGRPLPLLLTPEASRLLRQSILSTNPAALAPGTNTLKLIKGVWTNTATPPELLAASLAAFPKREIRPTPDGAIADFGRHRVSFPSQLNREPVRVSTPDGKLLKFQPRFLAYTDLASGKSVIVGEVKETTGEIQLPSVVLFKDCLTDVRASIRYQYTPNSLLQEILIESQLPAPEEWNLSPATTRVEFWTEIYDSPVPIRKPQIIQLRAADAAAGLNAVLATDETWDYGAAKITAGQAFIIGEDQPEQTKVPVAKTYVRVPDAGIFRSFLVEGADYISLKPKSDKLRKTAFNRPKRKAILERAALIQSLTPVAPTQLAPKPLQTVNAAPPPGLALNFDFNLSGSVSLPAGIVSWWGANDNADDAMGLNNGSLQNGADLASGVVEQAFYLTNGNYPHIQVPASESLNVGTNDGFTIEGWINVADNANGHPLVEWYDAAGNPPWGVHFWISHPSCSNVFFANIVDTTGAYHTIFSEPGLIATNEFYHVALTYNRTNSEARLYLNGANTTNVSFSTTFTPKTSYNLYIGCRPDGTYAFPGLIDELSIYSRPLAATEIWQIYCASNAGKCFPTCLNPTNLNIVGWWPGDGNANDYANTNNGLDATYASGESRQAFQSNVEIADCPDLNPTNALTLEAWIFMNSTNGDVRDIISKDGESTNRQYVLSISDVATFRAHIGTNNSPDGFIWFDGATPVEVGAWYHTALTYDGQTLKLYVNGELDGSTTNASGPTIATTELVRLGGGASEDEPQHFFPGLIDEAAIYNRALTASEISAIYSAGIAGKCKSDSDGDGLTDLHELLVYHTNPNDRDTDHDGLSDYAEIFVHQTNPSSPASTNGIVNLQVFTPLK